MSIVDGNFQAVGDVIGSPPAAPWVSTFQGLIPLVTIQPTVNDANLISQAGAGASLPAPARSAEFALAVVGVGALSQSFATVPGTTYTVTFYTLYDTIVPVLVPIDILLVTVTNTLIPAVLLVTVAVGDDNIWVQHQIQFTATTAASTITFVAVGLIAPVQLDAISIVAAPIICYSGKSLIHCRDMETGEIGNVMAKDIVVGKHEAFDTISKKFVPILKNPITGPTVRYMKIEKNLFGEGKPFKNFYVTSGHRLLVNGEEMRASEIPGAKRVRVEPENVYSLCVPKRTAISINGLDVMAWSHDKWIAKFGKDTLSEKKYKNQEYAYHN